MVQPVMPHPAQGKDAVLVEDLPVLDRTRAWHAYRCQLCGHVQRFNTEPHEREILTYCEECSYKARVFRREEEPKQQTLYGDEANA